MRKKIAAQPAVIALSLIVAVLILIFAISSQADKADRPTVDTVPDIAGYLGGFGWDAASEPSGVKQVAIPEEFNATYESYNELQKSQGFDLTQYRAQTVTMYTFRILNHPANTEVFANVLVFGGKIIGGDICSYAVDGFMTAF